MVGYRALFRLKLMVSHAVLGSALLKSENVFQFRKTDYNEVEGYQGVYKVDFLLTFHLVTDRTLVNLFMLNDLLGNDSVIFSPLKGTYQRPGTIKVAV